MSLRRLLLGGRGEVAGRTDVTLSDYVHEIVHSGFPGVRRFSGRALRALLDGYLRRIVDTDFQEQGFTVRRPETLKRWMAAYAAAAVAAAILNGALMVILGSWGVPSLTLSFCITTIAFLLIKEASPLLQAVPLSGATTPEEHLENRK